MRLELGGIDGADRALVERQLGRRLRGEVRVASRCPHGRVQVIATSPFLEDGTPFPTLFWLTCPLLQKAVSGLESGDLRQRLRERLERDAPFARGLRQAEEEYLRLREEWAERMGKPASQSAFADREGIGGTVPGGLKCLHAHLAHFLATGLNPVGAEVALELGRLQEETCNGDCLPFTARRGRRGALCGKRCRREFPGSGVGAEMRAAAVDIGTNSVRLLVADIEGRDKGISLSTLHRLMSITRLGEGVDEEGRLRPSAVERTLDVLQDYRRLMDGEGVEELMVAATSAVRDAGNAEIFRRRVEEITGKEPRVLSGEEEARLSFLGATYDLGELQPRSGTLLVADIGGGSTEVIVGEGEEIREVFSVDVGCVRMSERFLRSDPPTLAERENMERFLEKALSPVLEKARGYRPVLMIGLAGTVTTLSGVRLGLPVYDGEAIHHSWLTSREVEELYEHLLTLPVKERRRFMRLEPGRADVIAGGTAVLLALLRGLGQDRLLVSEKDILDGLVIDLYRGRWGG